MTTEQLTQIAKYTDEILELIETQLRNNENSLTQSDLQSAIDAKIHKIVRNTLSTQARI